MLGADHDIINKYIAVRTPTDGQFGLVKQAFVDCHAIMQLCD
jgi:hypothetical protein